MIDSLKKAFQEFIKNYSPSLEEDRHYTSHSSCGMVFSWHVKRVPDFEWAVSIGKDSVPVVQRKLFSCILETLAPTDFYLNHVLFFIKRPGPQTCVNHLDKSGWTLGMKVWLEKTA